MKSIFLFLSFLLLISFYTLNAQTINPGSQWRVDYFASIIGWEDKEYMDFIDGDTTINSKVYHKIYYSGGLINPSPPPYYFYVFEHELHSYLREEGDRWYTYRNNQDTLLYDFSLEVGDTLIAAFTGGAAIVEDIDSILVDGEYRKRMKMDLGPLQSDVYVIEGIGSTRGLFEAWHLNDNGGVLRCYAIDGIPVYSLWYECDLTVDTREHKKSVKSISISPNPAFDFASVYLPNDLGIVTCILMNSMGVIMFEENLTSNSIYSIPVSSYAPGIYIAIFENNRVSQKIKLIIK